MSVLVEVPAVLSAKRISLVVGLVATLLIAASIGAVAQDAEEFPGSDPERPLAGYTRGDGTIVLDDESFCRYVLTAALGDDRLTYIALLDKSKKQKPARKGAFSAESEAVLAGCTAALSAFRLDPPEDDELPGWARRAPVVPEALTSLLPEDFVGQPLARADEIGPAARTSGFGSTASAPFSVAPGPWLAELDAVGCETWEGVLRDAQDPGLAFPLVDSREYLYELDAGHYYWDVTASDCDWSVDLVPVVLGPEPTPTPEPRAVVPALSGSEWDDDPEAANPDWLTAAEAREAVLAAGLKTGACNVDNNGHGDRVWSQDPAPGYLVEYGTPVDIRVQGDCAVYQGDRVLVE